jgi:hypothetical protein
VRQRRVSDGARDRAMAEVVVDRARVLAIVGELVAAAVAKHVAVNQELEPGSRARPGNHALIAGHAQRCAGQNKTANTYVIEIPL